MAFSFSDIYSYDSWLVRYDDAQGYEDQYRKYCGQFARETDFPNLVVQDIEMVSGGYFSRERTEAVSVSFAKSTLKSLAIYFRPQRFGNVVHYSVIKTIDVGLWSALRGKSGGEVIDSMIAKLKNLAQLDEFYSLNGLGDLIFTKALVHLDPEYKEIRSLMSKAPSRGKQ